MKILSYHGPGERQVEGVGVFTSGVSLEVPDSVAASFDNDSARAHGWKIKAVTRRRGSQTAPTTPPPKEENKK